nr:RNA-directed DNA polymerase, eukaryota [Tanacetum cinerariifolium]
MKLISINVRDLGENGKKGWVRSIIKDEQPDVIGLQEEKNRVVDDLWIEDLWGGKNYGYAQLPAKAISGGIILIWDTRIFLCKEAAGDERFVGIKGSLARLMDRWCGAWCIFGDLNVVRSSDDRLNSQVNIREMCDFNEFINNTRLIKVPMGGSKFTRVSDDRMKFSKLDRFLVNDKFDNLWGNLAVTALNRKLSDHCPIVLKDVDFDFGPKPFRIFNIWMEEPDFQHVVEEAWKKEVRRTRPDGSFRDRLKNVKVSLRDWSKDRDNNKCSLRGLTINGVWCEDLILIKTEMARHYKSLFIERHEIRPIICCSKIGKISEKDASYLEKEFNETDRIKMVVEFVVGEVQNAFIKRRYILDEVLIANETMEFMKTKGKKG